MRILVVDDHVLFREGLISMLENQPDINVIGEAGSVGEAVEKALELKPELILMDLLLPDGSGLDAMKMILSPLPETKVLILTFYESDEMLIAAIRSGAKGYMLKSTPITKLIASLRAVERGEAALSRAMTGRILEEFSRMEVVPDQSQNGIKGLTSRELQVLEQLGSGATNREIANRLYIAENTVKIHVHNIYDKLNLKNRHEAVRFARRLGMTKTSSSPSGNGYD
jgi:DNA-binding NarL/FixJ family response regulator